MLYNCNLYDIQLCIVLPCWQLSELTCICIASLYLVFGKTYHTKSSTALLTSHKCPPSTYGTFACKIHPPSSVWCSKYFSLWHISFSNFFLLKCEHNLVSPIKTPRDSIWWQKSLSEHIFSHFWWTRSLIHIWSEYILLKSIWSFSRPGVPSDVHQHGRDANAIRWPPLHHSLVHGRDIQIQIEMQTQIQMPSDDLHPFLPVV